VEPGVNITLKFSEYDRTAAELAGSAYTGTGDRLQLGHAISDMNGNYIFRFSQSFSELVNEIDNDIPTGEDVAVQARPDIIVSVADSLHPSAILHETAPYFNVPQMRRIDICLPKEKINPSSLCFNGNLIGSLVMATLLAAWVMCLLAVIKTVPEASLLRHWIAMATTII